MSAPTSTIGAIEPDQAASHLVSGLGELILRIVRTGQIVRTTASKCQVGGAAYCQVRLEGPSIVPVHCLILRGRDRTVVRRWAEATLLNGQEFTDHPLFEGDVLQVAGNDIEVLRDERPAAGTQSANPSSRERSTKTFPQPLSAGDERMRETRRRSNQRVRRFIERLRTTSERITQLQLEALTERNQSTHLISRISSLEKQLHSNDEDQARDTHRLNFLTRDLEGRLATQASLHLQDQAAWQQERQRLRMEVEQLAAGHTACVSQREATLNNLAQQLISQRHELDRRHGELERQCEEAHQENQRNIDALEKRTQELSQQEEEISRQTEEAQRSRQESDAAYEQRQNAALEFEQLLAERESTLQTEHLAVQQQQIDVANAKDSIDQQRTSLAEQATQLQQEIESQQQRQTLDEEDRLREAEKAEQSMTERETQLSRKTKEMDEQHQKLQILQQKAVIQTTALADREEDLKQRAAELEQRELTLQESQQAIREIQEVDDQQSTAAHADELAVVVGERDRLASEIAELQSGLESANQQLAAAQDLEQQLETLGGQLDARTHDAELASLEVERLQAEVDALQASLTEQEELTFSSLDDVAPVNTASILEHCEQSITLDEDQEQLPSVAPGFASLDESSAPSDEPFESTDHPASGMFGARQNAIDEGHDNHAGEDSVEDYMRELMARVGGQSANVDPTAEVSPTDTAEKPANNASGDGDVQPPKPEPQQAKLLNLSELKSHSEVATQNVSLDALREVANASTRSHIARHQEIQKGDLAKYRGLAGACCIVIGTALIFLSDSLLSVVFAAACAFLVIGVLFSLQSLIWASRARRILSATVTLEPAGIPSDESPVAADESPVAADDLVLAEVVQE